MGVRGEHTRSGGRRRAAGIAGTLLVLALGVVAALGAASASGSTKGASATFSPGTSAAGASALYTLTLTNTSSSQTLGSANVTIPTGFSVTKTGAWAGSWTQTSSIDGNTIKLRAGSSRNAVASGNSLLVSLTVTAPCSTTATAPVWTTDAKQSNDFNGPPGNVVPVSPQPSIAVAAAGGLPRFAVSVGSPQAVGTAFTATISALDACGRPETSYNGTAALTSTLLSTTTTPPVSPSVPSSVTLSGGTGTASVTAVTSQTNATLTATDGSRSGTATFDVANVCVAGSECRASDRHGLTSIYTASPSADLQAYFADGGTSASCSNSALRGSLVTIKPSGNVGDVVFTWDKSQTPGTGVANFTLCWISDKPGASSEILPKCATVPADHTCEVRRSRTGVGDLQIVVRITQDPQFDLG